MRTHTTTFWRAPLVAVAETEVVDGAMAFCGKGEVMCDMEVLAHLVRVRRRGEVLLLLLVLAMLVPELDLGSGLAGMCIMGGR